MKLFLSRPLTGKLIAGVAVCLSLAGFAFLYAQTLRGGKEVANPTTGRATVEQARGEVSPAKKVRTELVRRLLDKVDSLDDISAEDKKELRKILLEADAELARAAGNPRVTGPGAPSGNRPAKGKPAQSGQEQSAKQGAAARGSKIQSTQPSEGQGQPNTPSEAKTPMVRALLKLLDEVLEDNLADQSNDSASADALRESLLRSDQLLRQYLGDASRARIEAANRKPPVPQVSNPRRKPSADAK